MNAAPPVALSPNVVMAAAIGFALLLFAIAYQVDRLARRDRLAWLDTPLVYTLSLSIYCTTWTFYGAVGTAARSGLEFATIYLGPTLVFIGWAALMRKIVRIGRRHRVTSIADFVSARFGKSASLAALVTLIAFVSTTPYIALQLKAVSASFQLILDPTGGGASDPERTADMFRIAMWTAIGLAAFTVLFGTRTLEADQRRHGLIAAIAFEAIVKLGALTAVGLFAVFWVADGPSDVFSRAPERMLTTPDDFGGRWAALTFLAGAAIICLPRQFQIGVVECSDERHGATASWMFPLYLFLISLFVLPIAIAGLDAAPPGADPDFFVLSLPLAEGQPWLALLAFLGGFASATSMMIVASIALSIMASNHLALPLLLRMPNPQALSGDVREHVLTVRRLSVCATMFMGFLYFRLSEGHEGLASIGLIAFAGVSQVLPALLAGLFWRRATALGAKLGLGVGFLAWLGVLFLPTVLGPDVWPSPIEPGGALHAGGVDPLVLALFWSLGLNAVAVIAGSLARAPKPLEAVQAALFDGAATDAVEPRDPVIRRSAASADLYDLAQRVLGEDSAHAFFRDARERSGRAGDYPIADEAFIAQLELKLAGGVGSAAARGMVSRVASGERISVEDVIRMADETAQLVDYSQQLEAQSEELARTAAQLRAANARLQKLDAQKDAFLSQVSHELRTPMASIRAFSEILLDTEDLSGPEARKFLNIVHDETLRLTRLLDQILDLRGLEAGAAALSRESMDPEAELEQAIEACAALAGADGVTIERGAPAAAIELEGDRDRLRQVFLNLLSNALKYGGAPTPRIRVDSWVEGAAYWVRVSDNGPGVPQADRERVFDRFARGANAKGARGLGVGLALCRDILLLHGGGVRLAEGPGPLGGAVFEIWVPLVARDVEAPAPAPSSEAATAE